MEQVPKETDLSHEQPSRRSLLPGRRPARAIGRHRRAGSLLSRLRLRRRARVTRITDLSAIEGDPTSRANPGVVRLSAELRPLRGIFSIDMEAPAESSSGTAASVVMLLVTGALLGAGALAAGSYWRFPPAVSAVITALLFVSPILTYIAIRRRR